MITCRSSLSIALVLSLVLALAVAGSDPAAAKKKPPPEPEWVWEVEIPMSDAQWNLWGGQPFYTDEGAGDGVWAEVTASRRGRGDLMSWFGFAVFKCEPGEPCYGAQPLPVQLQEIQLGDALTPREDDPGTACYFPGFPDGCGTNRDTCMECFLNGEHPYWDDAHPLGEYDYRYFSFEVTVPGDFEDIEYVDSPVTVETRGNLYINLFNTDETLLPPGEDDYHNIDGRVALSEGDISITRDGEDTWTVQVTVNPGMLFSEWYEGCLKEPNWKGNCPWVYQFPLDSRTSDPLSFKVTWTRIAQ